MSHEIHLPHHGDITAPLLTCADAARSLPTDDDRAVARQIVIRLAESGVATVGEGLARLEAMAPTERRALLDDARKDVGLPSTAEADSWRAHREQDRILSAAAVEDVELQLTPGPSGWIDPAALALEREQARVEAERRACELELRRAARAAELPELEAEERAEREHWRPTNAMPEVTT